MSKNKYLIIDKKNQDIEYYILVSNNKKKYSMYYSESSIWNDHIKNTRILTIKDTGNGFKFNFKEKISLKNEIDYSNFNYIRILMSFINKKDKQLSPKYDIIKK